MHLIMSGVGGKREREGYYDAQKAIWLSSGGDGGRYSPSLLNYSSAFRITHERWQISLLLNMYVLEYS